MKDNSIKSTADDSCQQRQHDHESATFSRSLQLAMEQGMDFSQIELRYRAEGNANLVLALPQFRKVLRLPKMSINNDFDDDYVNDGNNDDDDEDDDDNETPKQHQSTSEIAEKQQQRQRQQQQEDEDKYKQQDKHNKQLLISKGSKRHNVLASTGDLTMADYVGYIDVVRRLLGNEFIFDAEIIEIPHVEQRKWINEQIRPYRPAQRLDKEFCGQFGLMLPDATLLPEANVLFSNLQATPTRTSEHVYAIEIKPKQGWLLPSELQDLFCMKPPIAAEAAEAAEATAATAPATAPAIAMTTSTSTITTCVRNNTATATTRCRYCAMQYLKLKQHKIKARSPYCPMELFSGEPARMFLALSALLECPQNNLRIFHNGKLIYGDHSSSISWDELRMEVFKGDMLQIVQHLVVKCLLRNYEAGVPTASTKSSTKSVAVDGASTAAGAVVETVAGQPHSSATMQEDEELVLPDSEFAKKRKLELDDTLSSALLTNDKQQAQISEAELLCLPKNCVLHKVLHLQLLAKRHLLYMWGSELANNSTKSYVTLAKLLADAEQTELISLAKLSPEQRYLLGATALDCSVMIAFQETTTVHAGLSYNPQLVHLDEYEKSFLTKVTLLDLDPKPDSHFNKYVRQTLEATQCLLEA